MGAYYATDLADVCRGAGLYVVEVDGWQDRARGSGGFADGKPDHVMVHHTASGPGSDGWPDVNYCTFGSDDAPLCNLYLSRDGTVYVCAAGGTNTNGSGDCAHLSPDSMNSSAIGVEAGNDGVGEPWPATQTSAYLALVGALCDVYGIDYDRVHSHAEWAPTRKVDPYGPSPWGPGTWDMGAFRADLDTAPTPPEEPDMTDEQAHKLDTLYNLAAGAWWPDPAAPAFSRNGEITLNIRDLTGLIHELRGQVANLQATVDRL